MGCRCRPLGIQGTESLFSRIGCGRVCAHLSCAGEEVALLQRLADSWRPEHDGPHVLKDTAAAVAIKLSLDDPVAQVLIKLPACLFTLRSTLLLGCKHNFGTVKPIYVEC